jgi:HlyD family secretion protein
MMNMQSPLGGPPGHQADADELRQDGAEDPFAARCRRQRVLIAVAAVVLLLVCIIAYRALRRGPVQVADAAPTVTVMVPGRQLVDATVNASGIIAARHDMPVGAVGEGGMVTQVLVNPGDWVKAGQSLAIVERSVQSQQAASASAAVRSAEADAALAQSNLTRALALVKNGFISKADIDAKTAARDSAIARSGVAKAQLGEQLARNARLLIRAPAAGLVLTRSVEPGQIVMGGQSVLFRIAENGNMEMQARVAEQDLASMKIGTAADVTPVGGTSAIVGQIWQLSPVIDPTTRQGLARIALPYAPSLRPGGFAGARISGGRTNVPLLPESAVLSDDQGSYVLIVSAKNAVERRPVKVGSIGSDGVTILGGLDGSERVVTSAGAFLSPGQTVVPALEARAR